MARKRGRKREGGFWLPPVALGKPSVAVGRVARMVVEVESRGEYCSRGSDRRGLKEAEAPPPAGRGCTNERRTNGERTNERTATDRKRAGRRKFEPSTPSSRVRPTFGGGGGHFAEPRKTALPRDSAKGVPPPTPRSFQKPPPPPTNPFVHALTLSLSSFCLPFAEHRPPPPLPADVCRTRTSLALSAALIPFVPPRDPVLSAKCARTLGTNVLL